MDCSQFQRLLDMYLDGEFEEAERIQCATHVEACPSCEERVRVEQLFRAKLRESLITAPPSERLQSRVRTAIRRSQRHQYYRKYVLWSLVPSSIVVLGLVMIVGVRRLNLANVVDQSIFWHRTDLPMDVRGSGEEPLRQFFRDKVPVAVKPPRFGPVAKLVGGRLSSLAGHEAAHLSYRSASRRISVFVVDPSVVQGFPAFLNAGTRQRVRWQGRGGYNVGMFVANGAGYTVTSELDPGHLGRLISFSDTDH